MSELNVTVRYDGAQMKSGTTAALGELKRFESAAGPASLSLQKVAGSAALSGDKLAKFGTVAATVSGTMGALPIKGEAVAKVFGVMGDLAAGAVNPLYLIVGALGAVAAAFTIVKQRREEENRAIREQNTLLVENADLFSRRARMQPPDILSDYLARGGVDDLEKRIQEIERERASIYAKLVIGGTTGYRHELSTDPMHPSEYSLVPFVKAFPEKELRDLKTAAKDLTEELEKSQTALARLKGWGPETWQGPTPQSPDEVYRRQYEDAERQRIEGEQADLRLRQRAFRIGGSWNEVPADYSLRLGMRSASEDRQLGRMPDWLRGNIEQAGEEDARRMDAERERIAKTTAIYNEQIQTIRGTLDSMFSAAWDNASRGFDNMVKEMAKAALKHLGWFFLQRGLDAAAPGIGTALGFSPRGSGNKSMGSGFGADATAAANLARRAARG